uniref:Uncharacterized protein n=1 Tax=Leersia perrieri TaxID=77586 RepID=A0A0D9V0P7_9ORYZ
MLCIVVVVRVRMDVVNGFVSKQSASMAANLLDQRQGGKTLPPIVIDNRHHRLATAAAPPYDGTAPPHAAAGARTGVLVVGRLPSRAAVLAAPVTAAIGRIGNVRTNVLVTLDLKSPNYA